nr:MAG TPA: hypothetical protein [Caudoviricetes sp.]
MLSFFNPEISITLFINPYFFFLTLNNPKAAPNNPKRSHSTRPKLSYIIPNNPL